MSFRRDKAGAAVERSRVLDDAEYFAGQLIRCLEQLRRREPDQFARHNWCTASALTRRIRTVVRTQVEREQTRRAHERRLQESR